MGTTYYNPYQPFMPPPPPGPAPIDQNQAMEYSLEIPDGVRNVECITLDISKKTRARFAPLNIRQGDRNGTALIVTVVDTTNGTIRPVDLELADVYLEMLLPDKKTYYKSNVAEEAVENRALIVIDESSAATVSGNTQANVVIEQDDVRISTQPFRVKIVASNMPVVEPDPGEDPNPNPNPNPGEGTTDYNDLSNKPKINGVELAGDVASGNLRISYNDLEDLPKINGQELVGGDEGITVAVSYNDLTDKPTINGHELSGNVEGNDLGISYSDLEDKPTINGHEISGDVDAEILGISYSDLADRPKINGVDLADLDSEDGLVIDYNDLSNKPTINGTVIEGALDTDDVVDTNSIINRVAEGIDTETIATQLIESGILADDLIQTATNEQIHNIVANNSDPVVDHTLDR